MPNIYIRERDLTSAGTLDVTTNIVYIPGYANMGPINTPTLCETLDDFKRIFGNSPYRFKKDAPWGAISGSWSQDSVNTSTMGNFYQAGEYEKSYIMATQLLKLGLPILYERVFSLGEYDTGRKQYENVRKWKVYGASRKETKAKYKYSFASTNVGAFNSLIRFNIKEEKYTYIYNQESYEKLYYVISVKVIASEDLGIEETSYVDTKITFDKVVAINNADIKLVSPPEDSTKCDTIIDNSGLISFSFSKNDSATNISSDIDGVTNQSLNFGQDLGSINEDEFSPNDIYNHLSQSDVTNVISGDTIGIDKLLDKGEYTIKYLTSGAYPLFGYTSTTHNNTKPYQKMMLLAAQRGDCTALIDHTPNNTRTMVANNSASVYKEVETQVGGQNLNLVTGEDPYTFGAMFTPYGIYNTFMGDIMLPASYGYLVALAYQSQNSNNWQATAGVTRGQIPGLKALCQNLTNAIADSYQPRNSVSINAITNIKPYGLVIWGARTLKNNRNPGDLTATSFLNIRQITNDVKRQVWVAAKTLTYESNNDLLWIKFNNKITPLLDNMVNAGAISAYEIKKQKTDKKATIKATVRLYAIEPVEDWDITIELADSTTEVLG